ncbi:hypothetical protein AVEN_66282-1 [Araneus ventricosus]|uniref:Uncharacterized protein n=1 Tax=Araneus ventricosus TaxID=182803 RepID=A0A4Y2N952_ARAVE|nr:hypothetical protein AVEN_66282-1 [Araneus ventricosus]
MQLPTYADIMRHYYWLRNENRDVYLQPVDDLVKMAGEKNTSIPVVSKRTVNGKIKDYYKKCRSVEKSIHRKGIKEKKNREKFIPNAESSLFDISVCKCKDLDYCTYDKCCKVPIREITFLRDQRTIREMCIGNIDKQTSKALIKTVARKMKRAACSSSFVPGPSTSGFQSTILLKSLEDSLCDRFEESEWNEVEFERTSTPDTCKRISLSHTESAAFRTGVSERDVALIASAVLEDAGLVTENKHPVVYKNKIHRERKKLEKKVQEEENLDGLKTESVFFDERRDETLFIGRNRTSDIVDRKTKNISLFCLNLVLNILDI